MRKLVLLLLCGTMHAAITAVGGACATGGPSLLTSLAVTYSPTAGNQVIVAVSFGATNVNSPAVRDNNNNALSPNGILVHIAMLEGVAVAGATGYTASWNNASKASICVEEYSGVSTVGALNVNSNSGTSTAPSISVTTTANNSWIVASFGVAANVTFTATTGNLRQQIGGGTGNNNTNAIFDNSATSSGTLVTSTGTIANNPWDALALELKPTGGGTPVRHKVTQ
jgi:hypothetical protein